MIGDDKKTGLTFHGKEIVMTKPMGRPSEGLVQKGIARGIYPEESKVRAATLFAVSGDVHEVSRLTNIPVGTIKSWRRAAWFRDLINEIRDENGDKLDVRLSNIIDTAFEAVLDRLQNGDFIMGKKGELIRKPVSVRDLTLMSAITIDKRQLMRGLPTSRTESVNANHLDKLADAFMKLAAGRKDPKAIPVDEPQEETKEIANAA